MFNSKKSIRIETNASNLIIDAYFNQKNKGKQHFVTYFSRKFSSIEQNYDIHDKKLLAIIVSLKIWRIYAKRALELTIYTNHKNLIQFIIIKQLNRRQVRWSKLLKQYKFKIRYISKKENDQANALSRRTNYMKSKKVFNHNIFKINDDEILFANRHEINMTFKIIVKSPSSTEVFGGLEFDLVERFVKEQRHEVIWYHVCFNNESNNEIT